MVSAVIKRIQTFFDAYAAASLSGDAGVICAAYFPTYLEAAPSGVEAYTVDAQYREALKAKAEQMARMGLVHSAVRVTSVTPVAPPHLLVGTTWTLRFEPDGADPVDASFEISYVVRDKDETLQILLSLTHRDEETELSRIAQ